MYNGQNEYVPYKKRTKRLSNGQRMQIPVKTDEADIVRSVMAMRYTPVIVSAIVLIF